MEKKRKKPGPAKSTLRARAEALKVGKWIETQDQDSARGPARNVSHELNRIAARNGDLARYCVVTDDDGIVWIGKYIPEAYGEAV